MGIYALLSGVSLVLVLLYQLSWAIGGYLVSKEFHQTALERIIKAPMSFFDSTPTGRILNRFSNDMRVADTQVTPSGSTTVIRFATLVGSIILMCVLLPWLIIVFIPMVLIFVYTQQYYSSTSRECRRLDKISKSPIFAFFTQSIRGSSVVRAYQQMKVFEEQMHKFISDNQQIYWQANQVNRWLSVRLELLGSVISCLIGFFGVLFSDSLGSAVVGLMISLSLVLGGSLNWTLRTFVDFESHLTSVERILHYAKNTPQEGVLFDESTSQQIIPKKSVQEDWPAYGTIHFANVCCRYRDDLPFVLNNFELQINAQEKIGICGRTGAGKSSLITCLFRLIELSEGTIFIDGEDIAKLDLSLLRSRLSIIPQLPLLFPGTIRDNLDPFHNYSDDHIWAALGSVQMKEYISILPGELNATVADRGDNFSVGQKQLLCLARAILKDSKILILDEATASVDPETDQLIQVTIRSVFKHCTILTIAHRLSSIIDCDRVVVLDKGSVLELGPPKFLLEDTHSAFYQLVNAC